MGVNYQDNFHGYLGIYHLWRFRWLRQKVGRFSVRFPRVLELGCCDCHTLDYMPRLTRYLGIDADGSSLELGRQRLASRQYAEVQTCSSASELNGIGHFDVAIAMETLEHLPDPVLSAYLEKIASVLNGYFFITVPVEFGPTFFAKDVAQRIIGRPKHPYSAAELLQAAVFRPNKVRRQTGEHKGFDYRVLIEQVRQHFKIVEVQGMFHPLPPWVGLTVGIVARSEDV